MPFFLRYLLLFILLVSINPVQSQKHQSRAPNIILITADSHRGDALGIAGNPFIQTKHLDEMAQKGNYYPNAYVSTAICVVSRASILSGQHVKKHGLNDFQAQFTPEAAQQTYPLQLKKQGYQIAQIGFLGVSENSLAAAFDHWDVKIPWKDQQNVHQTDRITEKALTFLSRQSKDQPFYLAVSFEAAHEIDGKDGNSASYLIQERFKNLYSDIEMPNPRTNNASYFNALPDFLKDPKYIARTRWNGFLSSTDLQQENSRNYYRLLTGIDEAVGKIIHQVKALGLDQQTVIIYTADHGFSLSEHGVMGKWTGFEPAIHVPLMIWDLRSPNTGKSISEFAMNIDLAPTILELAHIKPDPEMQGIDLLHIRNGKIQHRPQIFYEHSIIGSPLLPKVEGIISQDYKYLKYIEHDYEFLFDRRKDPDEANNLSQNPKYQKILKKMQKIYQQEAQKTAK